LTGAAGLSEDESHGHDAASQADLLFEALAIASEMQKEIGLNIAGFEDANP
jgi:hypothetical protein